MTKFVVDASAWIDYFDESERGKRLAKILESDDSELFTSAATVAEVVSKFLRRKFPPENAVNAIISLSNVLDVTSDIAWETGKIHSEVKKRNESFGMLDAFVMATARSMSTKVLTSDNDFRIFKEAVFV